MVLTAWSIETGLTSPHPVLNATRISRYFTILFLRKHGSNKVELLAASLRLQRNHGGIYRRRLEHQAWFAHGQLEAGDLLVDPVMSSCHPSRANRSHPRDRKKAGIAGAKNFGSILRI